MKPGACFINTARESLVDEAALDAALASGHLAGAALDVVHTSTATGRHPLLRHPNVVMTPHIGGATRETLAQGAEIVAGEIARFAAGEPLVNVVNAVGAAAERRAAAGDRRRHGQLPRRSCSARGEPAGTGQREYAHQELPASRARRCSTPRATGS